MALEEVQTKALVTSWGSIGDLLGPHLSPIAKSEG